MNPAVRKQCGQNTDMVTMRTIIRQAMNLINDQTTSTILHTNEY